MAVTSTPSAGGRSSSGPSSAALNALFVVVALGLGLWLMVEQGQMTWPPSRLLTSLATLAGCLALVGPILLLRQERAKAGVGDLVWLTGGCLTWLYNFAAIARGAFVLERAPNPSGPLVMGLATGAVLLAGLRFLGLGRAWTWTNVTGWVLAVFWIVMGILASLPQNSILPIR